MSHPLAQLLPEKLLSTKSLRTARQLMTAQRREVEDACLSTGSEAFDRLLGGGLRRGRLTELVGRGSCGRFSVALEALATTTAGGEAAALIDVGDALCPETAVAAGIELDRLLWARPQSMKEALMATEAVISCGMPLVVLDVGLPPIPGGRGVEAFWLRLARSAQGRRSAVLVGAPYRVTGTAAQMVVEVEERRASWVGRGLEPKLLDELSTRLDLKRAPGRRRAPSEELIFRVESAVVRTESNAEESPSSEDSIGETPANGRRAVA